MADRIFPNSVTPKLGNKTLKMINWDSVASQVEKLKRVSQDFEEDMGMDEIGNNDDISVDDEIMDDDIMVDEDTDSDELMDESVEDEILASTNYLKSAGEVPKQFKPFIKKKKAKKDEKPAKEKKEDFASSKSAPKIAQKRVVAFTDPSQLSAEAVEAAIKAGDEELKNTILAARHQRRLSIAAKISQVRVASSQQRTAKVADSASIRMVEAQKIIDNASDNTSSVGFKTVEDLNSSEKEAFAKFASREGFPQEYVEYMLNGGEEPSEQAVQIVELFNSNGLSREAKVSAVRSMVKTAELTGKDINYLKNYWLNALGYDDPAAKEFVDALFTDKYNRKLTSEE